jgi:hypothetical protein
MGRQPIAVGVQKLTCSWCPIIVYSWIMSKMRICCGGIIVRLIRGNMGSFVFERGQLLSALQNLTEQRTVQRQIASYLNPSALRKIGLGDVPLAPLLPNIQKFGGL